MHKIAVAYSLGRLYQILGLVLLAPLALAVLDYRHLSSGEIFAAPEVIGFLIAVLASLLVGTALTLTMRRGKDLQSVKDGYGVVALGWVTMTLVTCVPLFFYFSAQPGPGAAGWHRAFTDAYFEIMSGYTTTGATILANIEALPRSLLLLRALSHWLGGMGIITLAIAIFPSMGGSAYTMFRGEVPGPSKDKLLPRLAQTATILWGVYVILTAAEIGLLWMGGMGFFDAACHAFATMATGGFSTHNQSLAAYDSDYIHWVITLFMFLAGANFVLHYQALRGNARPLARNSEFRFYALVVATAVVIGTAMLYFGGLDNRAEAATSFRANPMAPEQFDAHYAAQADKVETLYGSFKAAAFQTVSIVTTTGFCTADFDLWPDFVRIMLILLMFFGGCACSTGGGIKMIRILIVGKLAWGQLRKMTQPRLITPVKVGGQVIDDHQVVTIVAFFIMFVSLSVIIAMLMTLFVPDLTTAVTACAATIGNVGPGLAGVGATENYGWIPIPGKWILVVSMLLGRLEIFTVLIVLRPSVWRQ